jgi:hypothetical protein
MARVGGDGSEQSLHASQLASDLVHEPFAGIAIPALPGFYAWWVEDKTLGEFRPVVPAAHPEGCPKGWSLLYIGISPRNAESSETLATRLATHRHGKVERSTLRYSLAALLPGLGLRIVGTTPNTRKPRLASEEALSRWLETRTALTVVPDSTPWTPGLEEHIVRTLRPPLNGSHSQHPFKPVVAEARARLLADARGRGPHDAIAAAPKEPARSHARRSGGAGLAALSSQQMTRNDISRGSVRVPQRTKAVLPLAPQVVVVRIRGRTVQASWNPRTQGTRERSGVLTVGVAVTRSIEPGAVLAVGVASDGCIELD